MDKWKRIPPSRRRLFVAASCLVLGIALAALRDRDTAWLRYPHPILSEDEPAARIQLLERRLADGKATAVDCAELAGLLLGRARKTGDNALYDRAEGLARVSLERLPAGNWGAKLVLAEIAEARHEFAEAAALAEEVLREMPRSPEARARLITTRLAQGQLAEASRHADALALANPSSASLTLRALVLEAQGRDAEALFEFRRALSVEDFGAPEQSAWIRSVLARHWIHGGRYRHARAALAEALRIAPDYPLALFLSGEEAMARRHYEAASRWYYRAFEVSPQVGYLRAYAAARKRAGDEAGAASARKEVDRLVRDELKKSGYGHRLELVQNLLEGNTDEEAREALALVEEECRHRRSAESLRWLAEARLRAGQLPLAKEAVDEMLRLGSRRTDHYRLAARIEMALGREDRARLFSRLPLPQ